MSDHTQPTTRVYLRTVLLTAAVVWYYSTCNPSLMMFDHFSSWLGEMMRNVCLVLIYKLGLDLLMFVYSTQHLIERHAWNVTLSEWQFDKKIIISSIIHLLFASLLSDAFCLSRPSRLDQICIAFVFFICNIIRNIFIIVIIIRNDLLQRWTNSY